MPVDINRLTEGWLELESDPGLFTLLLENFGVKGVQVEEIYDLQKTLEGPVYGFIFLFRWIEERRSRRKIVHQTETFVKDEDVINNIFFAQQMVPNSCATHALLSVLLNCPSLHLGSTLSRLKVHTSGMAPENKGWAIGNTPELAKAHNSHAMPQAKWRLDKSTGITTGRCTAEAFHFVSYVPIQGRLFELDGLKPFPIDHGPWGENEEWTEKFRRVITERLGIASGEQYHDIRFNLMAVVPDKRLGLTHKLKMLKTNRQIVLEALQQLVKLSESKVEANVIFEDKKEVPVDANTILFENKPKLNNMDPPSFELNDIFHKENNCTKINLKDSSLGASNSALEAHNYVSKIHLVTKSGEALKTTNTEPSIGVKVENLLPPDYSTPLMIHTSPAPSGSSTDTSSEVGSAFNSPTQGWGWNSGQSSPASTKDFKKFVAIRIAGPDDDKMESPTAGRLGKRFNDASTSGLKRVCLDGGNDSTTQIPLWDHDKETTPLRENKEGTNETNRINLFEGRDKFCSKYPELLEPHTFAPKDLLALLKNLESEITVCEINLHDENEKRKKYKIDDCRRTHNYDEFICTFLSMLAQQGKLADLVEQHLLLQRKPGIPVPRVATKKQEIKPNSSRRRRSRAKNRKRK